MYKFMWYAPLGVFSLIAATVAKQGPQVLLPFILLATLAPSARRGSRAPA
jgi:Na+/H+-dicarboxylate symporter